MKGCLITHIADPDGAGPIILSKLVFDNMDYYSCEIAEVDETLKKAISLDYDFIYITDLNISEEMAEYINNDENLKNKIKIFDHHQSKEYLNKYSFINVVVEKDGKKECGTTIYYEFLKELTNNEILNKNSLLIMIEYIRQSDTWDFTEELKDDALMFRNLYDIYGRENYIEHFYNFVLENEIFEFTGVEKELIRIEDERALRYIEEKLKHVKKAKINGIPVGIVFAEQNRSMLGHYMAERFTDIDIAIIINVDRSVSYRANKEEVDTNILAVACGGGGHKHASGSPLPKDLQEKITEYIFKDVKWEELCK